MARIKNPKMIAVLLVTVCLIGIFFISKKQQEQKEEDMFNNLEVSEETKARIEKAKKNGKPALIVSNTEAAQGDTSFVTVSLVNNPGIIGLSVTLSYDESIVELEKVRNGEAFDRILDMEYSEDLSSGCHFMWDATDVNKEDIRDGIVLAMQFHVNKKAPPGKTPIIIICDSEGNFDRELSVVNLVEENGYITVN